jgi:D-alanyl-D-alanine carboxypeptidase
MRAGLPVPAARAMAWLALACMPWTACACGHPPSPLPQYRQHALQVATRLGAEPGYASAHGWTLQPEAPALVQAGKDVYGRPLRLAPAAAAAMQAMLQAAARDGIALQPVSGYRSFRYQRHLLRRKLDHGRTLAAVLQVNTLPGFSEHHSGCALDLTTPGVAAADAAFAATPAFAWLGRHARQFGFELSYPAGNSKGIEFEPWHWHYAGPFAADNARDGATLARASIPTYPIVQGYP